MQKQYLKYILKVKSDAKYRYFLNIKVHFFLKIYDYLRDLSLAVKNITVRKNLLYFYNIELVKKLDNRCFSTIEKLVLYLEL